ncbi:hypothetical protein JK364_51580 [Streptomyces sp. 110]|uniref:Uncharacterized protein n=1 Tax=Streptomyces endocoffeicus TaxID=2898945 RepID=A0ABS1Q7K3_9ACTN|nr:hypothetical protein [Streptomyces endocoffeicus]MBL1120650.1 hypothetical protein [Streptomyces endocoffeicus]
MPAELVYELRWSEVAAHIGAQLPRWPSQLRREAHVTAWLPAHQPEAVQVVTWPDWEPLYDMAYREAKNTPVRVACMSIGHEMRSRAVEHADWEITHMNELEEPGDPSDYLKRQEAERACTNPGLPRDQRPR